MARTADDTILEAKLQDAVRLSFSGGRPRFVGFLDERQADAARAVMNKICFENYMLWGGHSGSERVVFGAFPDFQDPDPSAFPIVAVTARFRKADVLTHRDFLGALLSHGINRETLGDFLVEEGRGILFVREEIADFLMSQVEKVGRVGVKLSLGAEEPLPLGRQMEERSCVVSSLRLDCIVAAVLGVSREKSASLISSGMVSLNHAETLAPAQQVKEGSKLSIRGKGRYILSGIGRVTKKGRLGITVQKYI